MTTMGASIACHTYTLSLMFVLFTTTVAFQCPDICHCSLYAAHGQTDGRVVTDCSGRSLTSVPTELDPNIVSLNLKRNQISKLPHSEFEKYENLSYIDLSKNNIEVLETWTFSGLKKLKSLNLTSNKISVIQRYAFSELSGDKSCSLTQAQCALDLTQNDLAEVEEYAFNMVEGIGIKLGNSSTSVQIEPYAFYGARNIPEIAIANIHPDLHLKPRVFTNTENIYKIKIANTRLYPIKSFAFEGLKGVHEILFEDCNIPSIKPYSFSGISYNPIVNPGLVLTHSAGNEQPYTHTNDINRLLTPGGLFNIFRCTLDSLPSDLFKDTNLGHINFQNNVIKSLQPHIFRGMTSPDTVTLRENSLEKLHRSSFGNLQGLRKLELIENVIKELPHGAFLGSKDIELFSLRVRKSTNLTVAAQAFEGVFGVGKMEIVGDGQSHLNLLPNAFSGMFDVESLQFVKVNIYNLTTHSFRGLRKVQRMSFVDCNIFRLSAGEFNDMHDSMGGIGSIDLSVGNKLVCDCETTKVLKEFDRTYLKYDVSCSLANGELSRVTPEDPLPECFQPSSAPTARPCYMSTIVMLAMLAMSCLLL